MDTTAVWIGLFYGLLSVIACYGIAMITSGLFARQFYRLYARVLIGICSCMLFSPLLRGLANSNPTLAFWALCTAQYLLAVVLGYGVYRLNRGFMQSRFLAQSSTAYFTFGTLANAAVVTLAFLHLSVTRAPSWSSEHALGASHYGPLVMMMAAMIFHTDFCLKTAVGDLRRFSRFTFIGYAVSFLGIGLSLLPYFHLTAQGITARLPLVESFFIAQSLLIAIVLYGWLVWRYESTPPLLLWLFAIVAEYHVLVTQWVMEAFGIVSWGIASLPLVFGIFVLHHYIRRWSERKLGVNNRENQGLSSESASTEPTAMRLVTPFYFVEKALIAAVFAITLAARFANPQSTEVPWVGSTFAIYACVLALTAVLRKQATQLYVVATLAVLAAVVGIPKSMMPSWDGSVPVLLLGCLSLFFAVIAYAGSKRGLRIAWQTPLVDSCFALSSIVIGFVFLRHFVGASPYDFQTVGWLDFVSLGLASLSMIAAAAMYRSRLPVYGVLVAMVIAVPPASATIGLLATIASSLVRRNVREKQSAQLGDRVLLFGKFGLPLEDHIPSLFAGPLSLGAIPLAILGFSISVVHVLQSNFANTVLFGVVTSAIVLFLLTRQHRHRWLYSMSIFASYFAVNAVAHGSWIETWRNSDAIAAHLLLISLVLLLGWCFAEAYAFWCAAKLRRRSGEELLMLKRKRLFYSGLAFDITVGMSFVTLLSILTSTLMLSLNLSYLSAAGLATALTFALAASVYRIPILTYASLSAITASGIMAAVEMQATPLQIMFGIGVVGVFSAAYACLRWSAIPESGVLMRLRRSRVAVALNESFLPLRLEATDTNLLLLRPLAMFGILCSLSSVVASISFDLQTQSSFYFSLSLAVAAVVFVISTRAFRSASTYLFGIGFAYAAVHIAVWEFSGLQEMDAAAVVHLAIAAGTSLLMSLTAILIAALIQWRCDRSDFQQQAYYAGWLQHVAFGIGFVAILGYLVAVLSGEFAATSICIGIGIVLAVVFSISGQIYRSPLQSYLALAAVTLAILSTAPIISLEYRANYATLTVAVLSTLVASLSWFSVNRASGPDTWSGIHAKLRHWETPPLWLSSANESLWSYPLAHVSILLASLIVFFVVQTLVSGWPVSTPIWLTAAPLFASAITLLITAQVGVGIRRDLRNNCDSRSILLVASLATAALTIHLTAQLAFFEPIMAMAWRWVLSWHLVVGTVLALLTWGWSRWSPQNAGLLMHVSMFIALVVFVGTLLVCIPPGFASLPSLLSIVLMTMYFVLADRYYQGNAAKWMSMISVGLVVVQIAALTEAIVPPPGSLDALFFAVLSVVLVGVAKVCREDSEWLRTFRDAALLYGWVALAWLVDLPLTNGISTIASSATWLVIATCVGVLNAVTFAILTSLYRNPLLSYLSCMMLIMSTACGAWWLGGISAMPICLASLAFLFCFAGMWVNDHEAEMIREEYGHPLIHFGSIFSCLLVSFVVIPIAAYLPIVGNPLSGRGAPLWPSAVTLLIVAGSCLLTTRARRDGRWLYGTILLGSLGTGVAVQTQIDGSIASAVLGTLLLMNGLLLIGRLVSSEHSRVPTWLRIMPQECSQPLIFLPAGVTVLLLAAQIVYLVYQLAGMHVTATQWPWCGAGLLTAGFFLHLLSLRPRSEYVYFVAAAVLTAVVGELNVHGQLVATDVALVILALLSFSIKQWIDKREHPSAAWVISLSQNLGNLAEGLSYAAVLSTIWGITAMSPAALTLLSLVLLVGLWTWMGMVMQHEGLIYAAIASAFVVLVYAAVTIFGVPLTQNLAASILVIGFSLFLYGANRIAGRSSVLSVVTLVRPSYCVSLGLPLLLVVAIPLSERSVAAGTLMVAGSFYLIAAKQSSLRLAFYAAAAFFNVAIYLWIPEARAMTGLYQLYVIPAALTVLVFSQLHRAELHPTALTSIRLAASGLILAASTTEVWLTKDAGLLQFVLVLGLSLAGIIVGIGLRIKPFVTLGVAFLVINVIGQLGLHFQQEGGIARAVILISVGLVVLSAMIFFNIHRERILAQYRTFMLDERWH